MDFIVMMFNPLSRNNYKECTFEKPIPSKFCNSFNFFFFLPLTILYNSGTPVRLWLTSPWDCFFFIWLHRDCMDAYLFPHLHPNDFSFGIFFSYLVHYFSISCEDLPIIIYLLYSEINIHIIIPYLIKYSLLFYIYINIYIFIKTHKF